MKFLSGIKGLHLCHGGLSCWLIVLLVLAGGCASRGKITNEPVSQLPAAGQSYTFENHASKNPIGSVMLLLTFSGGGTRAAALSYGVLEELRDTSYNMNGQKIRLLDEVDRISSVSGGSFTAAYYGLFGDKIFADFKDEFLYRDVEGDLKSLIFRFFRIIGRLFTSTSRTEDAIDYYDKYIFKGKTFADLQKNKGPLILINATDLNSHDQFVFVQEQFDFFCSDLSQFSIARAVAASSAVPVLFHPVLIERHPDCDIEEPEWLSKAELKAYAENNRRLKRIVNSMKFYLDENNPPYATLVDGGVTDNLGLRAVLRIIRLSGDVREIYDTLNKSVPVTHAVIIVVNASTTAQTDIGKSRKMPSITDTLDAVTDIQLHLYNIESNALIKKEMIQWAKSISSPDHTIHPYFIELNLEDIEDPEEKKFFNRIPTSFSLKREQSDKLIETAKLLLRQNPDYQKLILDLGASWLAPADEGGRGNK